MGGNVTAITEQGLKTRAEKIPLEKIGCENFRLTIKKFFKQLNFEFEKLTGKKIWDDYIISSNLIFNGSSSFVMNPELKNVEKVKHFVGDIDVMVPENLKIEIWQFLKKIENKKFNFFIYKGCNKPTISSISEQINTVFEIYFQNIKCNCQVDLEFSEFKNNKPSEWAKFSHSSSFLDAELGIKAVHHKYLLRALVGAKQIRSDIIIATPKSTPQNIKISKSKTNTNPRMLKFSVLHGVRIAYEPLLEKGNPVFINSKQVFKEIPSSRSNFINSVKEISNLIFKTESEIEKMYSFRGLVDLIKSKFDKSQIDATFKRYVDLLWGLNPRGQELEMKNPNMDFEIKNLGCQYFVKNLGLESVPKKQIEDYYKEYKK